MSQLDEQLDFLRNYSWKGKTAQQIMVDLDIFELDREYVEELVQLSEKGLIKQEEYTGTYVQIYISNRDFEQPEAELVMTPEEEKVFQQALDNHNKSKGLYNN